MQGRLYSWEELRMATNLEAAEELAAQKEAFAVLSDRCESWKRLAKHRAEMLEWHAKGMLPPLWLTSRARELSRLLGEGNG